MGANVSFELAFDRENDLASGKDVFTWFMWLWVSGGAKGMGEGGSRREVREGGGSEGRRRCREGGRRGREGGGGGRTAHEDLGGGGGVSEQLQGQAAEKKQWGRVGREEEEGGKEKGKERGRERRGGGNRREGLRDSLPAHFVRQNPLGSVLKLQHFLWVEFLLCAKNFGRPGPAGQSSRSSFF